MSSLESRNIITKIITKSEEDVGTYTGYFRYNKRNGHGIMKFIEWGTFDENNIIYVYDGNWKNDKMHGYGTLTDNNGGVYKANWSNNWNGIGEYIDGDGNEYNGKIVNLEKTGLGIMKYKNGDIFHGKWDNDEMDGVGKMKYANGDQYDGGWYKNQKSGMEKMGVMKYANGDHYNGLWFNNQKYGEGVMKYGNGDHYDGFWEDDEKYGADSIMKYANGDQYEGEWAHDKKNGWGTMEYANGDEFDGIWNNDNLQHGTMKYQDGRVEYGHWKNNIFDIKRIGEKISRKEYNGYHIETTTRKNISYRSEAHDPSNPYGPDHLIDLMNKNPDLLAFKYMDEIRTIERSKLRPMVARENKENSLYYECLNVGTLRPDNIVRHRPLLNLRSIGMHNGGYIRYEYILDAIEGSNRFFLFFEKKKHVLKSVVSDKVLTSHDHTSTSYCQEGQSGRLFEMKYIEDFQHNATKIQKTFRKYKGQNAGKRVTRKTKKIKVVNMYAKV